MSEAVAALSGTDQAAVLLLTLGEQEAAAVLKHMGAKDVQRIGSAMAKLSGISRDQIMSVLAEFNSLIETQTSVGVGAEDYIRRVLTDALGTGKAEGVIDRILGGRSSKGLDALKWMDARSLSDGMCREHPQVVSVILSYLERDHAAEVLALLPENQRSDIVLRIASLDGIQPSALDELDEVMERQFAGGGSAKTSGLGGIQVAADILNLVDPSKGTVILEDISRADEPLGAQIQDLMFVFDDLVEIDDRGMQELLRLVPGDRLLLALRAADDNLKEKIFKNMSQRAGEMLKDDLDARGPVKLSDVEAAQKEILLVARKAAEAGTIQLGGSGGEQFV